MFRVCISGVAAIDKHHWTPGEKTVENNEGSFDSVQSLDMRLFLDPIPLVGIDVDAESSMEGVETGGKRKRNTRVRFGKSRKLTSGASIIADNMNNLTNVIRSQNQQVTVRHLIGNKSLYAISECIERLKSIHTLVGTPLFHFASSLMDNADYREVVMSQPDDDHIIRWHM